MLRIRSAGRCSGFNELILRLRARGELSSSSFTDSALSLCSICAVARRRGCTSRRDTNGADSRQLSRWSHRCFNLLLASARRESIRDHFAVVWSASKKLRLNSHSLHCLLQTRTPHVCADESGCAVLLATCAWRTEAAQARTSMRASEGAACRFNGNASAGCAAEQSSSARSPCARCFSRALLVPPSQSPRPLSQFEFFCC